MVDSARRRRVSEALSRALRDISLPVEDYTTIRTWVNEELPQLHSPGVTSYLVFGSYSNDKAKAHPFRGGMKPTTGTDFIGS